MITVMGATGNTGKKITEALLVAGERVRSLGRSAALKARDWRGIVVRELLGQRDLTYAEATRILCERVGKPHLRYVQVSYSEMLEALEQAGLSKSFAALYVEMTRALNEGKVKASRTPENTTPTRFEDFAGELARVYETA
jgi:hypothetical protein